MGHNSLPTFGFNFAKYLTFHINKQQRITLSRKTVPPPQGPPQARAATATWSEELSFVLPGLRAQPREDTALSPAEDFNKMKNFQLTPF
jgi:hypothetical protein